MSEQASHRSITPRTDDDVDDDVVAALQARLAQLQAEVDTLKVQKAAGDAERAKLAKRLNAREGMLTSLSQNIPGILYVVVIPKEGEPQLRYVSEKVIDFYEYDATQPLGWDSHYTRIHPEDIDKVKALSRLMPEQDNKLVPYEYRVILPTKGLRYLAGQCISIREDSGDIAWYGYTADVTEQKLYAEAMITAQTAERANHAKSEFLSRMSHELRTPLNAVIGFAQLLQMDRSSVFGEEHRRRVNLIEKAGQHLLSMLGDVLDLSRIEAGDLPLSIEAQDVDAVAADALSMVSTLARRGGVHIDTQGVGGHVHAQADRVRLRQVLVNLLSNAVKYNRAGGQVLLRAWRTGDQVVIEVEDTGIGMSPAQQAQLFQPFNRLGVEQSGIEGTGIGLVIVRKLVTLMGGRIEVRSAAGQGSCFVIHLPAAEQEPQPSDHAPLDDEDLFAHPATILYAEDNEINVALVHQVIKLRPHWRLLVAMNGQRALALARRNRPDLMLIDMHLGDMDGLELAALLDSEEATRGIPRVALSADAMPDRIHAARANGFGAYLTKPLDVVALLRCLEAQLSLDPPAP